MLILTGTWELPVLSKLEMQIFHYTHLIVSNCVMLPRGLNIGFVPVFSYDVMLKYITQVEGCIVIVASKHTLLHKPASGNKPPSGDVNCNIV